MKLSHTSASQPAMAPLPIDTALNELRRFPRSEWLGLVRSDQSHRWRRGVGCTAEAYFKRLPELVADTEESLVVINGELILRAENGEVPALDDYQQRFPALADRIAVQFEVNRALSTVDEEAAEFTNCELTLELPGYEFLERVGAGSYGVVYRARQKSLGRDVAVKRLRTLGADANQVARQRQEAEILARLTHPNVVHIYEVLQSPDCLYLVMEFVSGNTLAKRINGRPLPPSEGAIHLRALAEAVNAVHDAGVLHRDLKPSNVLLTESGQLKVTDFGLAKLQSNSRSLTGPDSIVGTPSYMAPEQAMGARSTVGPAADVYSLGAILYELLSGRPPFIGATVLDTLLLIRSEEPVPLRRLQPHLPLDLETICLKCLAKDPSQRYQSAADLADDLGCFLEGKPIAAQPPSKFGRLIRAAKRHPAGVTAAVFLMALAGIVLLGWRINVAQQRRLSDRALVESIAMADVQVLPQLLDRLSPNDGEMVSLVRKALASTSTGDAAWVNLSLAGVTLNPTSSTTAAALLAYLPEARPSEIRLLVSVLTRQSAIDSRDAWLIVLDPQESNDARLKASCLAAAVSPNDSRWAAAAPVIAKTLVWQHPLDVGTYTTALHTIGESLVPALISLYHDEALEPVAREIAVGVITRFAAEDPSTLANLIVDADSSEFRLILPALRRHKVEAARRLLVLAAERTDIDQVAESLADETRHVVLKHYDRAQQRRAVAMVALWQLGEVDPALIALSDQSEPALRSWLIELLASLGVSARDLWESLATTSDASARQALVLAVGQAPLDQLSHAARGQLMIDAVELYRRDPHPGVHAACRWLLENRLDAHDHCAEVDAAIAQGLSPDRGWYVGANGHSYSVLRGVLTLTMGSPVTEISREEDEAAHVVRLNYSLAVCTHEVTIGQFLKFRERFFNRRYSSRDDCPANNITWFDAAAYCRWLSEMESVPEEQMCFPPLAEIGPGMKLPANWSDRAGYRLPTEAEWEYACRGGVQASRHIGEGKQLLSRYAWHIENSDDHAWPVGRLKPNSFGLFDMLGNVTERCQEPLYRYSDQLAGGHTADSASIAVSASSSRAFRGGNFGDAEHNLRSARRNANSASDEWALIGFRPVRRVIEAQ